MVQSATSSYGVSIYPPYRVSADPGLTVVVNPSLGLAEVQDARPIRKIVWHKFAAILFTAFFVLVRCYRLFFSNVITFSAPTLLSDRTYTFPIEELPWARSIRSQGLYVLIHGLFGSPVIWEDYVKHIKHQTPQAHIFTPIVPLRGNCSLELAAKCIQEVVENYLVRFPQLPVTLIGTSNGARIALYVESKLNPDLLRQRQFSIVSIAGVHYGTRLVNCTKIINQFILHKNLSEEFHFAELFAKNYLAGWHEKQSKWAEQKANIRYLFCGSSDDEQVFPYASSFPHHPLAGITYHIHSAHTHFSIVDGALPKVKEWLEWRRLQ